MMLKFYPLKFSVGSWSVSFLLVWTSRRNLCASLFHCLYDWL